MDTSCSGAAAHKTVSHKTVASCFWANVCEQANEPAFADAGSGRTDTQINADDTADNNLPCNAPDWLTWGQLGVLAAKWVAAVQQLSLQPGQHVASCLPNALDWILLDIALQSLGLVHVAIDPRETLVQRQYLIEYSQARYVLDSSTNLLRESLRTEFLGTEFLSTPHATIAASRRLAERVDESAAAQMLFTSGSAGTPKGVLLSHRNLLTNAQAKLSAAPQQPSDLRLNLLPFAHAYARTCELSAWILSRSRLAIATSWADMQRQARLLRPTLINVVPFLAERLAEVLERDPQALGGQLRLLQVGGAALPTDLWERLRRIGLPPLQGYGLTEAAPVVCSNQAGQQRPASVGPPVNGVDVRLDNSGVLWCRGPNVMLGYWRNPAATEASLDNGWLCTGDLAEFTADGHVRILGRASQQIVLSTGYNVSPELIERELCGLAGIERALVFGHGQPHVVALLWRSSAQPASERSREETDCLKSWQVRIAEQLSRFPRHAIPSRFAWIESPLTLESGLLTVKGSPRRAQIADCYRAILAELYGKSPSGYSRMLQG